jgi:hypothetical protein
MIATVTTVTHDPIMPSTPNVAWGVVSIVLLVAIIVVVSWLVFHLILRRP